MPRTKKPVNKIVKTMIYSDFLLISAGGLLSPIIAIYYTTQIEGGSIVVVGLATTIFWIVKSIVQVPVSWFIDWYDGESDDFFFMVFGSALASAIPLLYYFFARQVWHVYAIEALNGLANGLTLPTWMAVFTRHIDNGKEATEWMLHSNAVGIGFALCAAVGGALAEKYGFHLLFLLVSALMLAGTSILLIIRQQLSDGIADGGGGLADREEPPLKR